MALRCLQCGSAPRVKRRTMCHRCLSKIARTYAKETWRNRKTVRRLLTAIEPRTEARGQPAPTLAGDLEFLMEQADRAGAKALEAAARIGRVRPAPRAREPELDPEIEEEPIEDLDLGLED